MKRSFFLTVFILSATLFATAQVQHCDQSSCPAEIKPFGDCYKFTLADGIGVDPANYTFALFYEKADGMWAQTDVSWSAWTPALFADLCQIKSKQVNYLLYYTKGSAPLPTLAEIQAKYGKKKQLSWLFCVAEVKDGKGLGTVFVSQAFKTSEDLTSTSGYDKVLTAFKAHMKNVLKDNASLGIAYDLNKINFWIECKSRAYVQQPGKDYHTVRLGMNYDEIRDLSASCCTTEDPINKSRDGFIRFKNGFGALDVAYMIDFDYNKVK